MKKSVALFLLFTMLFNLSFITSAGNTVIFEENFDGVFSTLPSGWEYFGHKTDKSVTRSTSVVYEGNGSLHINATDFPLNKDGVIINGGASSPYFNIEAGKGYMAKIMIYNVTSKKISVFFKFFDKNKKQIESNSNTGKLQEQWEEVKIAKTAPENAVYCRIQLVSNTSVAGEAYFDNLTITQLEDHPLGRTDYIPPVQRQPVDAKIVQPTENGLKYATYTEKGDKLGDYSYAGFYAGQYELPDTNNLPLHTTLIPSGVENSDDTQRIQEAINSAALATPHGEMSVIKLKAGKYNINKKGLSMRKGVILSGEGQGPDGTILYAFEQVPEGTSYNVIKLYGSDAELLGNPVNITDTYVPVGSVKITVEDASSFKAGDLIRITQPPTNAWYDAIEMSKLPDTYALRNSNKDSSWREDYSPKTTTIELERTIKSIDGNTITLDFPLMIQFFKEYQANIRVIKSHSRIQNAGVENLRIVSYYNGNKNDEDHAKTAIAFQYAMNCFVQNVTAKHFIMAAVSCSTNSKQITVRNCSSLKPVSRVEGSRRYSFMASSGAQQILFTGCYSEEGRHDFVGSGKNTGPIVYSDSVSDNSSTSSENHTWFGSGLLFDNLYFVSNETAAFISFGNRGYYGTSYSHGWSSVNCVAWNPLTSTAIAHKLPLTYQNFLVGTWGIYDDPYAEIYKIKNTASQKNIYRTNSVAQATDQKEYATKDGTPFVGNGYKEAETTPVNPQSLFKAQLAERFTGNFKNAVPGAPIIMTPSPDVVSPENKIKVEGIYNMNASEVKVYIDDKAYDAKLDSNGYIFTVETELSDGTHKIYATQTVNGVESSKTADRFISIKAVSEFSNINSSDNQKTKLIENDKRLRYDEFLRIPNEDTTETFKEEYFVFASENSEKEPIIVRNHLYNTFITTDSFATIYTKVPDMAECKIKETGILINKTNVNFDENYCYLKAKNQSPILSGNVFGVFIHGSLQKNVDYYFRSYAIYTDINDNDITILGEISSFRI